MPLSSFLFGRVTPLAALLLACAAALWPVAPARAQNGPAEGESEKPAATETITRLEFEQKPTALPSFGVSFLMPMGATLMEGGPLGARSSVLIRPADNTWSIRIHQSFSTRKSLTVPQVLDAIVAARTLVDQDSDFAEQLKKELGVKYARLISSTRVAERTDEFAVAGRSAGRVYFGTDDPVNTLPCGYTVFQTGAGQFLIVMVEATEPNFPVARYIAESVVASMKFADFEALESRRMAAALAGDAFLKSITAADLEACFDKEPVFFRIYLPGKDGSGAGDTEVAYVRQFARKGQVGELTPGKERVDWNDGEREWGYLVEQDARIHSNGIVVDSRTVFWLSTDRTSELWSSIIEYRKGARLERSTQTGVRRNDRLTISSEGAGDTVTREWNPLPEQAYLSQVERLLLPRLAARAGVTGELGFYTYDQQLDEMPLRRDTFERAGSRWTHTWIRADDATPIIATLDAAGNITHIQLEGGRIQEPSDAATLKRLWARIDLQLEDPRKPGR